MYSARRVGRKDRSYLRSSSVGVALRASAALVASAILKSDCESSENSGQMLYVVALSLLTAARNFKFWRAIANCVSESLQLRTRPRRQSRSSQPSRRPRAGNQDLSAPTLHHRAYRWAKMTRRPPRLWQRTPPPAREKIMPLSCPADRPPDVRQSYALHRGWLPAAQDYWSESTRSSPRRSFLTTT